MAEPAGMEADDGINKEQEEKKIKLREKLRGLGLSTKGTQKELFDRLLKAKSANKKDKGVDEDSKKEIVDKDSGKEVMTEESGKVEVTAPVEDASLEEEAGFEAEAAPVEEASLEEEAAAVEKATPLEVSRMEEDAAPVEVASMEEEAAPVEVACIEEEAAPVEEAASEAEAAPVEGESGKEVMTETAMKASDEGKIIESEEGATGTAEVELVPVISLAESTQSNSQQVICSPQQSSNQSIVVGSNATILSMEGPYAQQELAAELGKLREESRANQLEAELKMIKQQLETEHDELSTVQTEVEEKRRIEIELAKIQGSVPERSRADKAELALVEFKVTVEKEKAEKAEGSPCPLLTNLNT